MLENSNEFRFIKIYIIAYALSYVYLLFHFNGSIDSFAPLHIGAIEETVNRGHLLETYRNTLPGFYILGSELKLFLGINSSSLLLSPIQLIPFTFLFFILIFRVSGSYLLASILSITELTTGFTGTQRVFLWPHGMGSLLYFTLMIIFLSMFVNKRRSIWPYHLATVIIGISLVFMSYDVIFTYLLFLFSFILYILVSNVILNSSFNKVMIKDKCVPDRFKFYNYRNRIMAYQSVKLLILLIIVELGFMNFVYDSFIRAIKSPESFTLTVIDKFLLSYFSADLRDNILMDIYVRYPIAISYYGYIKYGILLSFLIIFLFKLLTNNHMIHKIEPLFIISILSSMGLWAFIRLLIGNIEIGFFYYPSILSIAWIYKNDLSLRKYAVFASIFLLALNPLYHGIIYNDNLANKDLNKFAYLDIPLNWCKEKISSSLIRSDELTKNIYIMSTRTHDLQTMDKNDVAFLLNRQRQSPNEYFIINNHLNTLDIGNWIQIISWRKSAKALKKNLNISKILDSREIQVFIRY